VRGVRILVIGGTGLIGRPVARQLLEDGYDVRLLVRDPESARSRLGPGFDYAPGDVEDEPSLERALQGCDGVHLSLGGKSRADVIRIEGEGGARVARLAAAAGTRLLTYVSGSLVHEEYGEKVPEHRAKLAAEQAITRSGVPYVFFRPTYFVDNLPRHIQGPRAVVLGRPRPLHMVAAADFGRMVSRAFETPGVVGRNLFVHGPEAVTIAKALHLYCSLVEPEKRVVTVPLGVMRFIDGLLMAGKLRANLDLMGLLQSLGERGDPTEANRLLGAPTTTVREWCERQAASTATR
jgi:uncharacterized protein YbjT (DUF2867 family)